MVPTTYFVQPFTQVRKCAGVINKDDFFDQLVRRTVKHGVNCPRVKIRIRIRRKVGDLRLISCYRLAVRLIQ